MVSENTQRQMNKIRAVQLLPGYSKDKNSEMANYTATTVPLFHR